jgi:O-antigen/teichoic acid export membrane protein
VLAILSIVSLLWVARLVGAEAFGQAALAMSLASMVEVLFSFGLLEAQVRHRSADSRVFDTAFWTRLLLGIIAFATCLLGSGLVGRLYTPETASLFTVYAITLIFNAANEAPAALLIRKFRTRKLGLITVMSKVLILGTTVALALSGLGAWSIILGSLAGAVATSLMHWTTAPRWPRFHVQTSEARELLMFGSSVAMTSLLGNISGRLFLSLFGYFHGNSALGYVNLGLRLIDESGAVISRIAWKIGYPLLAKTHRDKGEVEERAYAITRYVSYFAVPVFVGLGATTSVAIPVLFGPEWAGAVSLAQALAAIWTLMLVLAQVPVYLQAIGRQGLLVVFGALDAVLAIGIVFATAQLSFPVAALAWAARLLLLAPVQLTILERVTGLSSLRLVLSCLPAILVAIPMALAVRAAGASVPVGADGLRLLFMILTGVLVYPVLMVALVPDFRGLAWRALGMLRRTGAREG